MWGQFYKKQNRSQPYSGKSYSGKYHDQPKYSFSNVLGSQNQSDDVQPPGFDPYEGCQGRWVSRNAFRGKNKSFGYFKCSQCQKTWMSAHAQKQFKQACKDCFQYFYAAYLWVNDSRNYQEKDRSLVDTQQPHRSDLCQACDNGTCDRAAYQPRNNYRPWN